MTVSFAYILSGMLMLRFINWSAYEHPDWAFARWHLLQHWVAFAYLLIFFAPEW